MPATSVLLSRASGLFFGLVFYHLCLAGIWTTAAQGHSTLSITPAFDQPPLQLRSSPVRFVFLLDTWDDEDSTPVSGSNGLYEAILLPPGLVNLNVYRETLDTFTPLAWINYRLSDALQFHLSQFMMPLDLSANEDIPTLLFAHKAENLPPRLLTVLQMHGKFSLSTKDDDTLHYTFYAGLLTAEIPYDFIAGARLGYMAGTSGFTIGIDYLYGRYATTSDIFSSFYAMGDTLLPGSNVGVFGQALLYEKSELFLIQPLFRRGIVEGEPPPVAIYAKPALHINRQWTVFYRFDRLHPRLGASKRHEHAVGLKFQPLSHIALYAEFIMQRTNALSLDVGGFRLSGTIRF